MTVTRHLAQPQPTHDLSGRTTLFFAVACGAIVANLYYAQPLVALIGPAVGLSEVAASLIVTLSQLGYGLGLLLLVPLGDLFENRRLVVTTLGGTLLALLVVATATSPSVFLAGALLLGVTSVVVQMLVPLAAHLAPEATRGRVIGTDRDRSQRTAVRDPARPTARQLGGGSIRLAHGVPPLRCPHGRARLCSRAHASAAPPQRPPQLPGCPDLAVVAPAHDTAAATPGRLSGRPVWRILAVLDRRAPGACGSAVRLHAARHSSVHARRYVRGGGCPGC